MAISGSCRAEVGLTESYTIGTQSLTYGAGSPLLRHLVSFTDGEGASQVEEIGTLDFTLTGGSDSIDLTADLDNPSGPVAFTGLKVLMLLAPSTNTGNVTVSTSSTSEWDSAIDGTITLKPGTSITLVSSNATAYTVTNSTKDLLGVTGTAGDHLQVAAAGTVA